MLTTYASTFSLVFYVRSEEKLLILHGKVQVSWDRHARVFAQHSDLLSSSFTLCVFWGFRILALGSPRARVVFVQCRMNQRGEVMVDWVGQFFPFVRVRVADLLFSFPTTQMGPRAMIRGGCRAKSFGGG